MGNLFKGSEVVRVGVQIEKNGRDFYDVLYNRSDNKDAKEVFLYLKGEEQKHISVFENILSKLDESQQTESYKGEYFDYMSDLTSKYIFTQEDKGKEVAEKANSDKEAIDLGIDFEEKSIVFYTGMKKVVPEFGYKTIDQLIEQEQIHLKQLTELRKKI